ncbi:MAG: hypothetical protein KIT07_02890 [Anaerolineales bacterium]|nr:hypothetical protein [Anaerolineales bacterium]
MVLQDHELLASIPEGIRNELITTYNEILRNYRERRWEPSELNGGKLCEIIFTIIRGAVDGSIPNKASKPPNMVDACRALEQLPASTFSRSIRVQIPRMLLALYEIRNNRNVGHVGGEVNPNEMDALVVVEMSKWLLAELVRVFHRIDIAQAAKAVSSIVEKTTPLIWQVGDKYRVLDVTLTIKQKTLLLAYQSLGQVLESDLLVWVEQPNASVYRRDVLRPLHAEKMIEYNQIDHTVIISPLGIQEVENNLLKV